MLFTGVVCTVPLKSWGWLNMLLKNLLNIVLLKSDIKDGYITERRHPSLPLSIYNYTAKALYEDYWDGCTNICRGLVVDDSGLVVGRPFEKFFELDDNRHPETHKANIANLGKPEITEKVDGSLISIMNYDAQTVVASRGSFVSDQAQWALDIVKKAHIVTLPRYTTVCELVHPDNRIVVDYGEKKSLIILAVIDNETGVEDPALRNISANINQTECVSNLGVDLEEAMVPVEGKEGYVLAWHYHDRPSFRVKVKFEEYKKLFRLFYQTSVKDILELVRRGELTQEYMSELPTEFRYYVANTVLQAVDTHNKVYATAYDIFRKRPTGTRKDIAEYFKNHHPYTPILFAMLDNKDIQNTVWDIVKDNVLGKLSLSAA